MNGYEAVAAADERARTIVHRDTCCVPLEQRPPRESIAWSALMLLLSGHMALESALTGEPPLLLQYYGTGRRA